MVALWVYQAWPSMDTNFQPNDKTPSLLRICKACAITLKDVAIASWAVDQPNFTSHSKQSNVYKKACEFGVHINLYTEGGSLIFNTWLGIFASKVYVPF